MDFFVHGHDRHIVGQGRGNNVPVDRILIFPIQPRSMESNHRSNRQNCNRPANALHQYFR